MLLDWASFLLIAIAVTRLWAGVGTPASLRVVRTLLISGAALRVVAVLAQYPMMLDLDGRGFDAAGDFSAGRVLVDHIRALYFSAVDSSVGERGWSAQAIADIAVIVIALVGPSVRAAFLVFSLAAVCGLVCTVVVFKRANISASMRQAAWLLFFWPTLWLLPWTIGKEAILLLAIGLITLGYVGRAERFQWVPLASGLALALAVRPHLAAVLLVSTCLAEWASRGWMPRRVAQSILTGALAVYLVAVASDLLRPANADVGALQEFALQTGQQTTQADVNSLFQPFVTFAVGPLAPISALETMAFWAIVFRNRRELPSVMRSWNTGRLVSLGMICAVLYVAMLGLTFRSSGLIALQRALILPTLLLVVAGAPATQARSLNVSTARRSWRTPYLASMGS